MKKIIVLFFFISFTFVLNAQTESMLGIRFGSNFSNFTDYPVNTDNRIGFTGGLAYELSFKKDAEKYQRILVAPELNFLTQGAKLETLPQSEPEKSYENVRLKNNYLQIPILIKYYFGILGSTKTGFYIEAGPYGAFLLKSQYNYKLDGTKKTENYTSDISNKDKLDYGASLGGGFSLASILSFTYRYNLGLKEILADSDAGDNKSWGLFIHFLIPLTDNDDDQTDTEILEWR